MQNILDKLIKRIWTGSKSSPSNKQSTAYRSYTIMRYCVKGGALFYVILFLVIFRLWEKDYGDHKGDDSGGEEMYAKLTDKVSYEGLACLGLPYKGNSIVGHEVEEEIVDYEHYRR